MKSIFKLFAIISVIILVIAQTTIRAQENETAVTKEEVQISSQKNCVGGGCAEKSERCGQKKHAEMKRHRDDSDKSSCDAQKPAENQKRGLFKRSQLKRSTDDDCKHE